MEQNERLIGDASEAFVDAQDLVAKGVGHPACLAPILALVTREVSCATRVLTEETVALRTHIQALEAKLRVQNMMNTSRDLICGALQKELGPDRTLRALGFDPERVAKGREEIVKGKFITLDQLKNDIKNNTKGS